MWQTYSRQKGLNTHTPTHSNTHTVHADTKKTAAHAPTGTGRRLLLQRLKAEPFWGEFIPHLTSNKPLLVLQTNRLPVRLLAHNTRRQT